MDNNQLKYPALIIFLMTICIFSCKKHDGIKEGGEGIVRDIDGNVYHTLIIGRHEWMTENLKTTRYNDGSKIENTGNNNQAWIDNRTGAYSWYDNDISNKEFFGALYNWYAVNTNNLCPRGWRVPSDAEWNAISRYIAGSRANSSGNDLVSEDAEIDPGLFRFVPGGTRYTNFTSGSRESSEGYFYYLGKTGRWWASDDVSPSGAWYRSMYIDSDKFYRGVNKKTTGFSIRCIRDVK